MIWHKPYKLSELEGMDAHTIHSSLGIEINHLGNNDIGGKMPVDERTKQPAGILHGGASVVLAESLGSIASSLIVDPAKYYVVGQSIQANHIRPGIDGFVHGLATPIHIGRKSHIWEIRIVNDDEKLVCVCRLTMAVLER
jgi:1,4-dihydroxy-2-naphthoyl-CoA hydrolase